ncbi:MAG: hypothetical protein ACP5UI_03075 [Thermoprotei archaeon]
MRFFVALVLTIVLLFVPCGFLPASASPSGVYFQILPESVVGQATPWESVGGPFNLSIREGGRLVYFTILSNGSTSSGSVELPAGTYTAVASYENGQVIKEGFTVGPDPAPIYVAFVWHDHQAPNFYPNGTFFAPWAFYHVLSNELEPYYPKGVYSFKAQALIDNPGINVSEEVSPPLLLQWEIAVSKGWYYSGEYHSPNGTYARAIRWTMNAFLNLSKSGRDEWLTSFYAHPISGYILSQYGWFNLMKEDLVMGENLTDSFTGVRQEGMWTPEMAFTMQNIDLMNETGIRITALSERAYDGATPAPGFSKSTLFQPYVVEDPSTGRTSIVFFRDAYLSNYLGFNNTLPTEQAAMDSARTFVSDILATQAHGGVVTIASDGENWIIMAKFPANVALFLNQTYALLDQEEQQGLVETVTLQQALKYVPANVTLNFVPTSNWVDGVNNWAQWTTGNQYVETQEWNELASAHSAFKAAMILTDNFTGLENGSTVYRNAVIGLFHASDSDYYWAQYVTPTAVLVWTNYVKQEIAPILSSVTLNVSKEANGLDITVQNGLHRGITVSLIVSGSGFSPTSGLLPMNLTFPVPASGERSIQLEGSFSGPAAYSVSLSAGPCVFKTYSAGKPLSSSSLGDFGFLLLPALAILLLGAYVYAARRRYKKEA